MKYLKVGGAFLIMVATIVAVLYLVNRDDKVGKSKQSDAEIERYQAKIDKNWANVVWDADVFDMNVSTLNVAKKKLKNGYNSLYEYNFYRAVNNLDSVLMGEFSKSTCDKTAVEKWYKGVQHIASDELAKNNPQIRKMKNTYKLYHNVLSFCKRDKNIVPQFELETGTWNYFSEHRQQVEQRIIYYKNSDYYKYIRNISVISTGLASVPGELNDAEVVFMDELVTQIVNGYGSDECNKSKDDFMKVYEMFLKEHPSDDGKRKEIKITLRQYYNTKYLNQP